MPFSAYSILQHWLGLFSHYMCLLAWSWLRIDASVYLLEGRATNRYWPHSFPGPPCGSVRIMNPGERERGQRVTCFWICAFGGKMHRN
ncbi:MAG: hypothetical protein BYD32DRAFT_406264 [Podila humilis]|nr:MAG: hypothetical protein BYD32DRAFT_406264 [Podila humilis]